MVTNVGSNEDLKGYTDGPRYCLIAFHDFGSEQCLMMDAYLEIFSTTYKSVYIYKVDVDVLRDATKLFGVSTTPAYFIMSWGQVCDQLVGDDKDKLEALLKVYNGKQPPPYSRKGNIVDRLFGR
ncbi:MAG: thioredoxin family protein [Blastocatellia bacterium]